MKAVREGGREEGERREGEIMISFNGDVRCLAVAAVCTNRWNLQY